MTCHALALRVPASADPGPVLDAAVRGWWPELPHRWPALWHDLVPARFAEHRLRAELRRPVTEWGPAFRAVLLRYEDGGEDGGGGQGAHLVLVAHHAVLAPAALRDIAHVLRGARTADGLSVPLGSAAPPQGPRAPRIDWATGDATAGDRTGVLTVPSHGSPAAAALVLARYEHREPTGELPPYAAVLDDAGPPDPAFTHGLLHQSAPFPSPSSHAGPPSSCTTSSGTSTKPPPRPSPATSLTCGVSWATAPSRRSN